MPAEMPMLATLSVPLLALLHEGGWDEMIMVAVGLIVAYVVITWTGRRSRAGDDDEEADDEFAESAGERPVPRPDDSRSGTS